MTFIIIIGVIFCFLLVVLLSDVSFYLKIDDKLKMYIKFWFFRVTLPLKSKSKSPDYEKIDKLKSDNAIKRMIKEKGLSTTVSELWSIFKPILLEALQLVKKLRIKRLKLNVVTASEEAAVTALEYGALCATVFPILSFLKSTMSVNEKHLDISILADYDLKSPVFHVDLKLSCRLFWIIVSAFNVLKTIIIARIKKTVYTKNKI